MTKYKIELAPDFLQTLAELEKERFDFMAAATIAIETLFVDSYKVVAVSDADKGES